jgi:hypothetical protein
MALRFAAALDVAIQKLLNTGKPLDVEPPRKHSLLCCSAWSGSNGYRASKQQALLTTIHAFLQHATGQGILISDGVRKRPWRE